MDSPHHRAYLADMDYDQTLDARGLLCPLPVLKARKRLQGMTAGMVLRVQADDPMAAVDFPHFCTEAGHQLLAADRQVYLIRKGA